jgi:predicted esterase
VDPHIPKQRVDETAEALRRMEADVTARIYPGMGHQVNEDEIAFTRDLMATVAASGS